MDHTDVRRNASPVLQTSILKRKRDEIADSQSEDGTAASDEEFGWANNEDEILDPGGSLD